MRMRTLVLGALGIALGGTVSCGGSGSSGPAAPPAATEALLVGDYHYLTAGGALGPPQHQLVQWGVSQADGVGQLDVTAFTENVDATIGPGTPFSTTYAVDPDGTFHLGAAGFEVAQGGIAADGRLVLMAATRANEIPALLMLLRRGSGLGASSMAGTWHMLMHSPAAGSVQLVWGTATFDGLGGTPGPCRGWSTASPSASGRTWARTACRPTGRSRWTG